MIANTTTYSRTWADIAKPFDSTSALAGPIRPAERGAKTAHCRGQLLVILGHYGWIVSHDAIEDAKAEKHGGRIYLSMRDVRPGCSLKAGDEVEFDVYSDDSGLGAEDCFASPSSRQQVKGGPIVSTSINDFPPLGSASFTGKKGSSASKPAELKKETAVGKSVLESNPPLQGPDFIMRPAAQEFVPVGSQSDGKGFSMNPIAKAFEPAANASTFSLSAKVFVPEPAKSRLCQPMLNSAFFDDDSSDSDDDSDSESSDGEESESPPPHASKAAMFDAEESWRLRNAAAAAKVCAEVGSDIRWDVVLEMMNHVKPESNAAKTLTMAALAKPCRVSSPTCSTSSGEISSFESSNCSTEGSPRAVRPPPGLLAPPGLAAPPGL